MFNQYPYLNENDLNLDYILATIKKLKEIMDEFVTLNTITFADPIVWNITTQYAKNTVVLDTNGNAYLSKVAVPAGVQLNNTDYWLEIFNFTEYTRTANQNLTVNVETNTTRATAVYNVDDWLIWDDVLYKVTSPIAIDDALIVAPAAGANIIHFTVEDFIKAFMTWATNTIQQYKNDIDASELLYRQQLAGDIANTTASLQAQLDAAIAGVTVDSEVINARIGFDGTTYNTLHDAIVGQVDLLFFYIRNIANFVKCGNFTRNASASIVQQNDIQEGENYRIYVYEISGMAADNPILYMLKPDATYITITPTKRGAGYLYFDVTVPSGGYDRLRLYGNKDPNSATCHCRYSFILNQGGTLNDISMEYIKEFRAFLTDYNLPIRSTPYIENVIECGAFSSANSAAITNMNVTASEHYRIYVYNSVGMDTGNPVLFGFRADDTFYGLGEGNVISNGKYWDIVIPSDIVRIRLYANKNSSAPSVSCNYAIVKDIGTIGDVTADKIKSIDTFTKTFNKSVFKIFKKVVCCGDSYTAGYIHLTGESPVTINEDYAWPHYLATASGNSYVNCGASGTTCLSWPTSSRGLVKAQASGRAQAYILALMINDIGTGVPLGTSADIGDASPTTYYGGMSKIIRDLAAISPDAKIFVCTCPRIDGQFPTYNAAVRDIVNAYASTYNVHCLDLYAYRTLYTHTLNDFINGHYTALGYEQFAEIFAYIMSQYIVENVEDFQNVFKISYD